MRDTQRQWDALIRWTARRTELMSQMRGMVVMFRNIINEVMQIDDDLGGRLPKRPRIMGSGSGGHSCASSSAGGGRASTCSAGDGRASSSARDGRACASSFGDIPGSKMRISTGVFQYHVLAGNQRPRLRPAWMSVAEWNAFLAREEESDEDNGGDKDNGSRG